MISVLLPVYNGEKFLATSIRSILNQTYKDFEFLIIDDGSTDNTDNVVKYFDDNRIKYIKKNHTGLADTLNFGLKIAKYDWIARMDADDISHPKRFEIQIKFAIENPQYDIISSWYVIFDEKINYVIKIPEFSDQIKNSLVLFSSVCHPSAIFKKDILLSLGGYYTTEVYEDYEIWLRIKEKVEFYNLQMILLLVRKNINSLTNYNFLRNKKIHYIIQEKYYLNLEKEFGIQNVNEQIYFKALREYFFGDKYRARFYLKKLGINILNYPKAIAVFIFTYLSENTNKKIIDNKFWLRINLFKMKLNKDFRNELQYCESLIQKYNYSDSE
ncbi:MAG: glycosyltransferase [Melioribacteraceae bacterium]